MSRRQEVIKNRCKKASSGIKLGLAQQSKNVQHTLLLYSALLYITGTLGYTVS